MRVRGRIKEKRMLEEEKMNVFRYPDTSGITCGRLYASSMYNILGIFHAEQFSNERMAR